MWEVFNGGRTPYPAVDPQSLIQLLEEGRRLERPFNAACSTEMWVYTLICIENCTQDYPLVLCCWLGREVYWGDGFDVICYPTGRTLRPLSTYSYEVMRKCWREDPEERPIFSQLSSIVDKLLTSISGYTELSMVPQDIIQETEQLSKFM